MKTCNREVAVALFIFNRPAETERVKRAIMQYAPTRLLIVGDGPRSDRPGEAEVVEKTRKIAEDVNWECMVTTRYSDRYIGCKLSVASGLDWVFECCEEAIILEDDCVPSLSFFEFASNMLDRYRSDLRIHSISGSFFGDDCESTGHYFSRYPLMWGWATWRNRWAAYQLEPTDSLTVLRRVWGRRPIPYLYWRRIFVELEAGRIDTWDYQWVLAAWRNDRLTVRPTVNLVENIGFNQLATHTITPMSTFVQNAAHSSHIDLSEPISSVIANVELDKFDEQRWALINSRSVVRMYLSRLAQLAGLIGGKRS